MVWGALDTGVRGVNGYRVSVFKTSLIIQKAEFCRQRLVYYGFRVEPPVSVSNAVVCYGRTEDYSALFDTLKCIF